MRDLNDPDFRLAQIAHVVMERERVIYGRRIDYDEALAEAIVWFKRRHGDGILRVKFDTHDNAAGFIVRKARKPQPILRPNLEKAKELLRRSFADRGRRWW